MLSAIASRLLLNLAPVWRIPPGPRTDAGPLWRGDAEGPTPAYLGTFAPRLNLDLSPLTALKTPRYRYVRAPRAELYDLANDPGELRNLAPEQPELVADLDRALEQRIADAERLAQRLELAHASAAP